MEKNRLPDCLSRYGLQGGFVLLLTVTAILARITAFPHASSDYYQFLQDWYATCAQSGWADVCRMEIGDYTPAYIYLLKLLTYLPFTPLSNIKIGSCAADFVLAYFAARIVYQKRPSLDAAIAAYAAVLFLPTVLINSAAWAQCDAIYTTGLVACVYYLMEDRPIPSMVAFGIAFAFKLQAIFLAPFLLILWLRGKLPFRRLFIIPAVYMASILPAAIAGRSVWGLLTVYFQQTGTYTRLNMNAPNLYAWIADDYTDIYTKMGVIVAFAAILALAYFLCKGNFQVNRDSMLLLALFSAALVPFLLPRMHERYFFPSDLFSLLFLFYFPRKWPISLTLILCSTNVVFLFLFGNFRIPAGYLAIAVLVALLLLAKDLFAYTDFGCDHTEKNRS